MPHKIVQNMIDNLAGHIALFGDMRFHPYVKCSQVSTGTYDVFQLDYTPEPNDMISLTLTFGQELAIDSRRIDDLILQNEADLATKYMIEHEDEYSDHDELRQAAYEYAKLWGNWKLLVDEQGKRYWPVGEYAERHDFTLARHQGLPISLMYTRTYGDAQDLADRFALWTRWGWDELFREMYGDFFDDQLNLIGSQPEIQSRFEQYRLGVVQDYLSDMESIEWSKLVLLTDLYNNQRYRTGMELSIDFLEDISGYFQRVNSWAEKIH